MDKRKKKGSKQRRHKAREARNRGGEGVLWWFGGRRAGAAKEARRGSQGWQQGAAEAPRRRLGSRVRWWFAVAGCDRGPKENRGVKTTTELGGLIGWSKETYLEIYRAEMVRLDNQVKFILGVVEGDIVVCKRKKAEVVNEREKGFNPMPKQEHVKAAVIGAEDDEETESTTSQQDTPENPASTAPQLSDYEYMLSMANGSLTIEKVKELFA
ncbi:hypothetical protein BVRB_6g144480 [Beta vulgaris subsp. vulgaris]|nr:hypothetical protein BVRB_6g144480 [Beta vulgaris subsp. vulgaris]